MQEVIEKKKEKLKHKIAIKPVFKPKPKEGIKEQREIPVEIKTEKFEGQQKVKAGFVPPAIVRHVVEGRKTNFPLFGHKKATKISASEEKIKSTAMEIKVKREVKEHLKGSVEEVVSEPQELKTLSNEIKEFVGIVVKTEFDSSISTIEPSERIKPKVPEIKPANFTPSTPKAGFDTSLPDIIIEERVVTIPELSIAKLPEVITRTNFDEEVLSKVDSVITGSGIDATEATGAEHEISMGDFDEIKKDEETWITSGSTGLPSDVQLFYIHGKKGSGFEVFKGLLALELIDRGRKPKLQLILSPKKQEEKLEDISDDKCDYYKLVWIENCPIEFLRNKPKIVEEVMKALKKGILKYIVFTNQEEILTINIDEFRKVFLKYGDFSIITLAQDAVSNKGLIEIGKTFAKILQINRKDVKVEEIINSDLFDIPPKEAIDPLWNKMEGKKNSALETLRDKYENKPEIRDYLQPSSKLENESDEHFVMKQLVVKEILERGKKKWEIEELDGRDYQTEWGEKEARYEDYPEKIEIEKLKFRIDKNGNRIPVKRPDVTVRTEREESIWIEVETCKNLDDPLKAVKDKLRVLTEVEETERPDEIWVVFPYRKYFLYGAKQFEKRIRSYFNQFRKSNSIEEFKPRIFFTDLYEEKLVELKKKKDKK